MERYADVVIPLGSSSKLEYVHGSTITAAGRELEVDRDNVFERPRIPDFMLYSDQRELVFAMPGYRDSCVLDIVYVISENAPHLVAEFEFGRLLPVRQAKYSYSIEAGLLNRGVGISIRTYNTDCRPEIHRVSYDYSRESYDWDLHDLPAYPDEPWMPPRESLVPRVLIGARLEGETEPDWNGFAMYYNSVLPDADQPASEVEELAAELLAGAEDESEKIRRVVEYLGKNLRYVAIDLGESGFIPNEPDVVLENRYGDCKDMTMLGIALLGQAGITAYPALVLTRTAGRIDKDLLVPRFNHMILCVETAGGGHIWADPTAGVCPLGHLPVSVRGVEALVIKGGTALWLQTPDYTIYPSDRKSFTSVSFSSEGYLEGKIRQVYRGDFALSHLRTYDRSPKKERPRVLGDLIARSMPDTEIGEGRLVSAEHDKLEICIEASFKKTTGSMSMQDRIALDLNFPEAIVSLFSELEGPPERRFSLWFPDEWRESDTVCVEKPDGWTSCVPPEGFELRSAYGSGKMWHTENDSQLIVVRDYSLRADSVGTEDIGDFVEFWEDVKTRSRGRVIFEVAAD
jgi:transglutaminase-like putative cysteine protease